MQMRRAHCCQQHSAAPASTRCYMLVLSLTLHFAASLQTKVRLMVDAEHSYFQDAIDAAALELQRAHNSSEPVVYNTYQCYRKDTHERCAHMP